MNNQMVITRSTRLIVPVFNGPIKCLIWDIVLMTKKRFERGVRYTATRPMAAITAVCPSIGINIPKEGCRF